MPSPLDQLPIMEFANADAFAAWLELHHAQSDGVRIRLARKGSGIVSITYPEAVEVALCYGWIDGQTKKEGDRTWLQRFSPRAKRSVWSKLNREKVQALIDQGRMRPAGLREIERAQADGRWDAAYDAPSKAAIPPDLAAEFKKHPRAAAFFETLDSRNRYAVLHRLQIARKAETRARKLAQFVEMLERSEKLY